MDSGEILFYWISFTDCRAGQFQCGDGKCVNSEDICDGKYDCVDAADERDCSKYFEKISTYSWVSNKCDGTLINYWAKFHPICVCFGITDECTSTELFLNKVGKNNFIVYNLDLSIRVEVCEIKIIGDCFFS